MSDLVGRVRTLMGSKSPTREVSMFGGLAFMVNEKIVVGAGRDRSLLVRVDPERNAELLARDGARPAEMGAGRVMGPGWISVAGSAIATDDQLSFWLAVALEHNERTRPAA